MSHDIGRAGPSAHPATSPRHFPTLLQISPVWELHAWQISYFVVGANTLLRVLQSSEDSALVPSAVRRASRLDFVFRSTGLLGSQCLAIIL